MSSYLSQSQKTSIDAALDRLHDTFAADVFVYVEKHEDASADLNFNALYSSSNIQPSASYNTTLIKHTIKARVKYIAIQNEGGIEANIPDSNGRVRLKVLPADYEIIKICSKLEIDNAMYIVDSDAAIEGMFSDNYYTIYCRREG
jgi:hypothetical protein